ncbi:MAG: hypothetical protein HYV07_23605 [Deltaproteobacteria bacterium]|nr:hypothetical protein [Deltaproteobacteria bacterium]
MRVRPWRAFVAALALGCSAQGSPADARVDASTDGGAGDAVVHVSDATLPDASAFDGEPLEDAVSLGALCESCIAGPDCSSFTCLRFNTGERFCGQGCSDVDRCPRGFDCRMFNGVSQSQCVPTVGTCSSRDAGSGDGE